MALTQCGIRRCLEAEVQEAVGGRFDVQQDFLIGDIRAGGIADDIEIVQHRPPIQHHIESPPAVAADIDALSPITISAKCRCTSWMPGLHRDVAGECALPSAAVGLRIGGAENPALGRTSDRAAGTIAVGLPDPAINIPVIFVRPTFTRNSEPAGAPATAAA